MTQARVRTVIGMAKENVAKEMAQQTSYNVTMDMVTWVRGDSGRGVFVAHINDNVTIVCKIRGVGELDIRTISWLS